MQIPVLIEPIAASGFRARSGEPLPLTAEGATGEEALNRLRLNLESKLQDGSELVTIQVGTTENPWSRGAGMWSPDDPMIAEWLQDIENYRRKVDEEDARR